MRITLPLYCLVGTLSSKNHCSFINLRGFFLEKFHKPTVTIKNEAQEMPLAPPKKKKHLRTYDTIHKNITLHNTIQLFCYEIATAKMCDCLIELYELTSSF